MIGDKKILVGVADDHTLLRSALARLIGSFRNYQVVFEAGNGKEVKRRSRRMFFRILSYWM